MEREVVPPDATHLRRGLLLTWGILGLCLAVPVMVWQATANSVQVVPGWWVTLIFLAWAGAHLAVLIAQGRPRLPEFSTWLFIYVFMGLAPAVQLRTGIFPNTTPGVAALLAERAVQILFVSLLFMELGLWAARQVARTGVPTPNEIAERRATLLALAGMLLAAFYVSQVGLSALFSTRNEIAAHRNAIWPDRTVEAIVLVCAYVPLLVAVHALVRVRRVKRAAGEDGNRNRGLTFCCLALLLLVINPVSSPRYVFGTVVLSLLFLAGAFSTPARVRVALVGITAALVFVFPYADVFRTPAGGHNQTGLVANLTINGDYDAFAQMVNTVSYVEARGTTDGRQALGVALFWIPRSTWEGKPTDTGILLGAYKDYNFTNLSAPIWSEMYINAGWPAVVVGSILLGFFVGRGGERIGFHDRNNTPAAVGMGILSFYLLILLRGSLLQAMANLTVLVACTLFVRQRRAAAPAGSGQVNPALSGAAR